MLMKLLADLTLACAHRHVGWPQHNRQRCLDCGRTRRYELQRGVRGPWVAPERPGSERKLAIASAGSTLFR